MKHVQTQTPMISDQLFQCGFYHSGQDAGHDTYQLDPALGAGTYRIYENTNRFFITFKNFSYRKKTRIYWNDFDSIHADCSVPEGYSLEGHIGQRTTFQLDLIENQKIQTVGLTLLPNFCQEILQSVPELEPTVFYEAFQILNTATPFAEGSLIMSQIRSLPLSYANGLYYEAKLKEFIFYLIDRQTKLLAYTENGRICVADRQAVEAVIQYLNDCFDQPLCLTACERVACMSKSKLSVLFKQITGSTMSAYLTGIRMEKAKTLLFTSNSQVQQITKAIGFQNPSSFSAVFRAYSGYSPKEYRTLHTIEAIRERR